MIKPVLLLVVFVLIIFVVWYRAKERFTVLRSVPNHNHYERQHLPNLHGYDLANNKYCNAFMRANFPGKQRE